MITVTETIWRVFFFLAQKYVRNFVQLPCNVKAKSVLLLAFVSDLVSHGYNINHPARL